MVTVVDEDVDIYDMNDVTWATLTLRRTERDDHSNASFAVTSTRILGRMLSCDHLRAAPVRAQTIRGTKDVVLSD